MLQTLGSSSGQVLDKPVPGGRGLTTLERQTCDRSGEIRGWGSDLALERRPGVPRDKAPELGVEWLYPRIPQQSAHVKIHKSTEHARLTPVFGTACPPSGLSGRIRDFAYGFSEGRLVRWVTLLFADRVNVVEDLAGDLAQGRFPNLPREMGWAAEWRHNRAGVMRKAVVLSVVAGAALAFWQMRRRRME